QSGPSTAPDPAVDAKAAELRLEKALTLVDVAALEKDTRPSFSLHVIDVARGSKAEAVEMKIGDLIGTVNGNPVRGADALPDQTHGNDAYSVWSPKHGLR